MGILSSKKSVSSLRSQLKKSVQKANSDCQEVCNILGRLIHDMDEVSHHANKMVLDVLDIERRLVQASSNEDYSVKELAALFDESTDYLRKVSVLRMSVESLERKMVNKVSDMRDFTLHTRRSRGYIG